MTCQLTSKFEDDLFLGPPSSYKRSVNFLHFKLRYYLINLEYHSILINVGLILNILLAILAICSADKVGKSFQNSKVTGEGTVISKTPVSGSGLRWIKGWLLLGLILLKLKKNYTYLRHKIVIMYLGTCKNDLNVQSCVQWRTKLLLEDVRKHTLLPWLKPVMMCSEVHVHVRLGAHTMICISENNTW